LKMSEHINKWINAYLDGELSGKRLAQVEIHLSECAECQVELASLQALSNALNDASLPKFLSAERFAANVALNLPRKQTKSLSRSALEITWWLMPVALTFAWLFIHTTLVLTNWVGAAGGLGLLNNPTAAWLIPAAPQETLFTLVLGQFGMMNSSGLELLDAFEAFADSIVWQVAIALLYVGWIATWWARQRRRGYGQPLANGSGSPVK